MLAGLIFATEDAGDRPDTLAATLPFGGATLIEHQARLLIDAGAGQVMIAVARVTPELLGAAARIRKRGVAIDIVRSATETAEKVHPLAHVVVLADGLITTADILAPFAQEGGDLLLVTDGDGLERIDATSSWAGVARIGAQRLDDAAAMPRDYDFLSTLVRVAVQHGAGKHMLPDGAAKAGHGIERDARGLAKRGRGAVSALAGARERWVERWVFGPVVRLALPTLVAKGITPPMGLAAGAVAGAGGLWAIWRGWAATGLAVTSVASAVMLTAAMLAVLRGDERDRRWADGAGMLLAAAAVLLTGFGEDQIRATATGSVLAVALVVAAGLVERLRGAVAARRWWPAPAAYPLLLIPFAAIGQSLTGLAALALYAALTLLGGIEEAREALARP